MPLKFDSRPVVLRRPYTATMRATVLLNWRQQMHHGLHLFFTIAAAVVSRAVANQQVLDSAGAQVLGKLYVTVALTTGIAVAAIGWFGRNFHVGRMVALAHVGVAALMIAAFVLPVSSAYALAKYIAMEISAAVLLLVFGITLGARLGPRDARRTAARVGAGGILGGLVGGGLNLTATYIGSQNLFVIAALLALAPVFWLPRVVRRSTSVQEVNRARREVPELIPYGRSVAVTTFVMVAATTLIDYQFRYAAAYWYDADRMTAFFGVVAILAGFTTVLFQLTILDRLLDRLGVFATATIMPGALIVAAAIFGLAPTVATLVLLKLVDSGANMSVQQATGGLLLAPLSTRARSVWQGRIDGLAKKGGLALTGVFLAFFPLEPTELLPLTLIFCALWIVAILITRFRYVELLTAMLQAPPAQDPELQAYDGATVRALHKELWTASSERAAVILDLLEDAGQRAPDHALERLVENNPGGRGALLVIEHLASLGDAPGLLKFARDPKPDVASAALLALDDVDPLTAERTCRDILAAGSTDRALQATAAGLLAGHATDAVVAARKLAQSHDRSARLALAQALERLAPGASEEVGKIICMLAQDADAEIARAALRALGKHFSTEACRVSLQSLKHPRLRGAAMRTLSELGPPVVKPIADALLARLKEPAVASALIWALGQIGARNSVEPLLVALHAEHTRVRLSAAVALGALLRRRPGIELPVDRVEAIYLSEIRYHGFVRLASSTAWPTSPAGIILKRVLRQHAQASLETLFRLLALTYPEDSIQGAFQAITSRDRGKRQLALELLDAILAPQVRHALAIAVGASAARTKKPPPQQVLAQLSALGDRFLAGFAAAVQAELDPTSEVKASVVSGEGEIMTGSMVDQILQLQSLTVFSQASAEDLAELASMVSERDVSKGEVVYRQGEPGDAMYIVRSGSVSLSRDGEEVDRSGAGEAIGILSVLDRLPRESMATAITPCSLLVIKAGDLQQLLADRPLLMHSVFRALTTSIRGQYEGGGLGKRSRD